MISIQINPVFFQCSHQIMFSNADFVVSFLSSATCVLFMLGFDAGRHRPYIVVRLLWMPRTSKMVRVTDFRFCSIYGRRCIRVRCLFYKIQACGAKAYKKLTIRPARGLVSDFGSRNLDEKRSNRRSHDAQPASSLTLTFNILCQ